MKKLLCFAIALVALATLSGCSTLQGTYASDPPPSRPAVAASQSSTFAKVATKIGAVICGNSSTGMLAGGGIGYLIGDSLGISTGATTIIGAALGANCGQMAEDSLRAKLAAEGQTNCSVRTRSVYRNNVKYVVAEVENCGSSIARSGYRNYGDSGNRPLEGIMTDEERALSQSTYDTPRGRRSESWRDHRDAMGQRDSYYRY